MDAIRGGQLANGFDPVGNRGRKSGETCECLGRCGHRGSSKCLSVLTRQRSIATLIGASREMVIALAPPRAARDAENGEARARGRAREVLRTGFSRKRGQAA